MWRRSGRGACLATALASLAIAGTGAGAAAAPPLFGFNDSPATFAAHAGAAARAGARIARVPVSWELVQPRPATSDWSSLDGAVAALHARGIRVLFVLGAAPAWARPDCTPDSTVPTCPPDPAYDNAFARFGLALLKRYPGARLQAWNEPNIAAFGALSPSRAAALTNVLRPIAPRRVIAPAPSPGDGYLRYATRMERRLDPGTPIAANFYPRSVVSTHSLDVDWPRVRRIAGGREIWVTEVGFASSEYGRQGQARRAGHALRFLARHGARAIIFHRLMDQADAPSSWLGTLGVLGVEGREKPAFRALARAVVGLLG